MIEVMLSSQPPEEVENSLLQNQSVLGVSNQGKKKHISAEDLSVSDLLREHQDPLSSAAISISFQQSLKQNYSISLFFLS